MLEFAQTLYDKLVRKLAAREKTPGSRPLSPDQRLGLISKCMDRLKDELSANAFTSEMEEISFFKDILPQFLSLHIYYAEKFDLEMMQKLGSAKFRTDWLERQTARIDLYYRDHADFLKYYWTGKTHLDRAYFLRSSKWNQESRDALIPVMDPSYCTIYSIRAATLMAYSRLEKDIDHMRNMAPEEESMRSPREFQLEWTGTKVEMIELIYSLNEVKAFNNGNTELNSIILFFERTFSIDLGNVSSTFQKIALRKKSYTSFMDRLKERLDYRMRQVVEGGY